MENQPQPPRWTQYGQSTQPAPREPMPKSRVALILAGIGGVFILFCVIVGIAVAATGYGKSSTPATSANVASTATHTTATTATATHAAANATSKPTATPKPQPTATPKPKSTATSRPQPTATPRSQPTATPVPAQPTPCPGVNCNPWGYNFNSGNYIYSPPSDFCNYFNCIPSFWSSTNGYVEECQDDTYSHSGGRSGSCSDHGGNLRPLLS